MRPLSSTAAIVNPTGVAGLSRHFAYAYVDGFVPSFTADQPGEYTLQLSATLEHADRAYGDVRTSTATLRLTAQ